MISCPFRRKLQVFIQLNAVLVLRFVENHPTNLKIMDNFFGRMVNNVYFCIIKAKNINLNIHLTNEKSVSYPHGTVGSSYCQRLHLC